MDKTVNLVYTKYLKALIFYDGIQREACAKYDAPLPEYDISASGIMVLCKACNKYLELLSGHENNSLIADERINERKQLTKLWELKIENLR